MQLRNDDLIVGTTTNLGWRSCVRGVIWLREVLKEVRRPRLVDKAQTCFDKYITQYTYLNRGLTVLISFHTTSLPSYEECNPPLLFFFFFYQHVISSQIYNCLGFAFVILTQSRQTCGVNYYLNWDTLLGSASMS